MKRRSLFKFSMLLVCLVLAFSFTLGCQVKVEEIGLDSTGAVEIVDGTLTFPDLIVKYSDGTTKTVPITKDMISEEDLAKLNTFGTHRIKVTYQNVATEFEITIVGEKGDKGDKGDPGVGIEELKIVNGELVVNYTDGTSKNLGQIVGAKGDKGEAGIGISDIKIDTEGNLIITLTEGDPLNLGKIVGDKGDKGDKGDPGQDGRDGQDGKDGQNGREIKLRVNEGKFEWQYEGDTDWNILYTLDELKGEKGDPGQDGKDGQDGQDGLSAYELYKKHNPEYEGDEAQWLKDLASGKLAAIDEMKAFVANLTTEITYDFETDGIYNNVPAKDLFNTEWLSHIFMMMVQDIEEIENSLVELISFADEKDLEDLDALNEAVFELLELDDDAVVADLDGLTVSIPMEFGLIYGYGYTYIKEVNLNITFDTSELAALLEAEFKEYTLASNPERKTLYQGYELVDKDGNKIKLIASEVSKVIVQFNDDEPEELEIVGETDPHLWFNVQKATGTYKYTVVSKDGLTHYYAEIVWENEQLNVTPKSEEPILCGDKIYRYHYVAEIDITPNDTVYQIKPNGEITKLTVLEDNDKVFNIYFRVSDEGFTQEEGIHSFIVKKDGKFYTIAIEYVDQKLEGYYHVKTEDDLRAALANEKVNRIVLGANIQNLEEIIEIDRPLTIEGNGFSLTFTNNDIKSAVIVYANDVIIENLTINTTRKETWNGAYAVQVYDAKNVTLRKVTLTGGDAALLVNGSEVKLEGTIDVSGNAFGGIEVSKGKNLENKGLLDVANANLINTSETLTTPTIWIEGAEGSSRELEGQVEGVDGKLFERVSPNADKPQTFYYVDEDNKIEHIDAEFKMAKDFAYNEERQAIYQGYLLYDKEGNQISLFASKLSKVIVKFGETTKELEIVGESDPHLWFNVLSEGGTYTYTIISSDGLTHYHAKIEWTTESVQAVKQGDKVVLCGDNVYRYHYVAEINITPNDTVYQVKPSGETKKLTVLEDNDTVFNIYFRVSDEGFIQEEGEHKFIVNKDGFWYSISIEYNDSMKLNGLIHVNDYDSLIAAIANNNVTDIILQADIMATENQTYIDIGDKKIDNNTIYLDKDRTLTIDLNSFTIGIEINIRNYQNEHNLNVTLKNGTIGVTNNTDVWYGILVYGFSKTSLEIENITGLGYYAGLYTNGTYKEATVKATNCEFYGRAATDDDEGGMGAYLPAGYTYSFTNCKFVGITGVHLKSGNYMFTNCTITANGNYALPEKNGNGANSTGNALMIEPTKGYTEGIQITINGCKITSENGYAIAITEFDNELPEVFSISQDTELSGKKGEICVLVANEKALNWALENEFVNAIVFMKDITGLTNAVHIRNNVHIIGNGSKLEFTSLDGEEKNSAVIVFADGVIIEDLTVKTVRNEEKWTGAYAVQVYDAKNVTLRKVTLTGGDAALLVNGSEVTLEGAIDVSGNAFGGIEVSKGELLDTNGKLIIAEGAIITNDNESATQPTIWIEGDGTEGHPLQGEVLGEKELVKVTKSEKHQVFYYLNNSEEE